MSNQDSDTAQADSKLKRYMIVKTTCQIYEVYEESKSEALDMVKFKRSGGLSGSPNQKGYNSIRFDDVKLEEYRVTNELEISRPV